MAQELERHCDAWFAAWTGGDVERLVAHYAEDCVYSDPTRPKGLRGKGELRRYLQKWLPMNPGLVWTRERLYPTPGGYAVTWTARIPVGSETLTERGMDLVLLDERGLIRHNEVYFDMAAWRAALGR